MNTTNNIEEEKYNKSWYFDFLSSWIIEKNSPSADEQEHFLSELMLRVKSNANNKNLRLLSESEVDIFWEKVGNALKRVEDKIIIDKQGINKRLTLFLLDLKGSKVKIDDNSNDFIIKIDNYDIYKASSTPLSIECLDYNKKSKTLKIIGNYPFAFKESNTNLTLTVNGETKIINNSHMYSEYKVFGRSVYKNFPFTVEIKINDINKTRISFNLSNKKANVPLNLIFNSFMAKLAGRVTYWNIDGKMFTHTKQEITIKKSNLAEIAARETLFLFLIATTRRRPKTALLRLLYWITLPFYKNRNIWLYADKIYKAGDNAEWLYRYALKKADKGIEHYYVLNSDSPDVDQFNKDNMPYLKYKTIKQRLLFLNSKIIVFTHNNAPGYYRFGGPNEVYFRGLFNYSIMYIQHGLTVQDTAWLYKKSMDNFKQFFIASPFEKENLLRPAYGYQEEDLVIAGATRYDGLVDSSKKNIIIAPTWRTYLAPPGKDYGQTRDPNSAFTKTDFFKIYSSLIKNSTLIESAKKYGYSIDFLLHPVMSSQIKDFETDGSVRVITANDDFNYRKALTEASMMITDFSGIQFDFAYMHKPLLYFHPPELPASYDQANYIYKDHSLGRISTSVDNLVSDICYYMSNNCEMEEKYSKRIESFFYYNDLNNCSRTYDHIIKWQTENA